MKKLLFLTALFSIGVYAQGTSMGNQQSEAYSPNDGMNPPGTFTTPNKAVPMKQEEKKTAGPLTTRTGITNSAGVKPNEVNPAPNAAPSTEKEAIKSQALKSEQVYKTGPYNHDGDYAPKTDEEIQAEEERDAHLKDSKTIE